MDTHTLWLILSALLVGTELLSGTLYLLAVAVGPLLAALLAWQGLSLTQQLLAAAAGACLGVWLVQRLRPRQDATRPADDDIGQPVRIVSCQSPRQARVHYRGTEWQAELSPDSDARLTADGVTWLITGKHGNTLLIAPAPDSSRP